MSDNNIFMGFMGYVAFKETFWVIFVLLSSFGMVS